MIIGALLASTLALATPAKSGSWLSDKDYPAGALKRREEGSVGFRLLISPKGSIARCEIAQSSNSSDLDGATCNIMIARLKFKPAINEMAQPNYALFNGRLTWILPGRAPRSARSLPPVTDIELAVQKLPDGLLEKNVRLFTRFDDAGHLTVCESAPDNHENVKLTAVACAQAKTVPVEIIRDNDGNPISVIRDINIMFKAAA